MRVCGYEKCRRETKSLIKGYCPTCYARYQRNGSPEHIRPERSLGLTQCSNQDCESPEGPFIKGLCRPCYQRQYATGSVERQRVKHLCRQPGCDEPVRAHGLCGKHAMRVRRCGDVGAGRPAGWGTKKKHPYYHAWAAMQRMSHRKDHPGVDERWRDFWNYVEDIGPRPSDRSRIYQMDPRKPYGPDNFEWREPLLSDEGLATNAERQRDWRNRNPDRTKRKYLWRHYKITLERYEELLAEQGGKCAICLRPERVIDKRTGEPYLLAVDHDHDTKAVRGLLCMNHNRALGMFEDNQKDLGRAIAYLERHAQGSPT